MILQIQKAHCEWQSIPGYNGFYKISQGGFVKSFGRKGNWKTLILKNKKHSSGYKAVTLSKDNVSKDFLLHRLVAQAFIPNPENKQEVNHKNGVKDDNRYINLDWTTKKENNKHASQMGLFARGQKHYLSKLTNKQVRIIKWALYFGAYQKELAKMFNIAPSTLTQIKNGRTWKHIII